MANTEEDDMTFPARYIITKSDLTAKELQKLQPMCEKVKLHRDLRQPKRQILKIKDKYESYQVKIFLKEQLKDVHISYESEHLKQISVGEFPTADQSKFKEEFGEFLKQQCKGIQICDVSDLGNAGDAVVLIHVESKDDSLNLVKIRNFIRHERQFFIEHYHTHADRRQNHDKDDTRQAGSGNRNRVDSTSSNEMESIELESVEKVQLVLRLLGTGKISFPADKLKYGIERKEETVLKVKGENKAVQELTRAIEEQYASKEIYTVEIRLREDIAQLFIKQLDYFSTYITQFLQDEENQCVVILPHDRGSKSLAVSAFCENEAEAAAQRFENQLLCAHVSTAFMAERGKRRIEEFIKDKGTDRTAVMKFKEEARHVEVYGAPTDVIKLVGELEQLVFDNESQGGWR